MRVRQHLMFAGSFFEDHSEEKREALSPLRYVPTRCSCAFAWLERLLFWWLLLVVLLLVAEQ